MLFNSLTFAAFFPIALIGAWSLRGKAWKCWIITASYVFYGAWSSWFLLLMIASTSIDYFTARKIEEAPSERARLHWLQLSLGVNLGILFVFKYADFFLDSADVLLRRFGFDIARWQLRLVLPIGISFYTFHTLSYTIDVYRRHRTASRSFLDFAAYVAFFPQLVAGPIARAGHLLPQFEQPRCRPTTAQMQEALWLIPVGFFKKLVIADNLAPIVGLVFAQRAPGASSVLLGTFAFAFQIYGDFSGYSDIARGTAKLMGVDLTLNFHSPYLATGASDFWRRWHISLSSWLRDYLYVPLGGNREGVARTYRNLMLTMLLGGLWHGAAWTYVIWGGYHGLWLVAERLARGRGARPSEGAARVGSVILSFAIVSMGWMIFRATSVAQVGDMLLSVLTWRPGTESIVPLLGRSLLLAGAAIGFQLVEERDPEFPAESWSVMRRVAIYAAVFYAAVILGAPGSDEFIYFRF